MPRRALRLFATITAVVLALALAACGSGGETPDVPSGSAPVSLSNVFRFDASGALPVGNDMDLAVAPGTVSVQWFTVCDQG